MLFNSFVFFIFLGVVLPIFYALEKNRSRNLFLIIASYVFYGYWDWRFCSLLALSTIIDFFIGKSLFLTLNERKRKYLLILSLISNLGILSLFKYYNFFADSFQSFSQSLGLTTDYLHLNILLPVGISFYTFQTLSYTIDIYRRRLDPTSSFIDFALFVSFFPQLVAGPIERAKTLLPQLSQKYSPSKQQLKEGVELIILGLFRKVMIGDTAGRLVDQVFGSIESYRSIELICALILFSIQIYADFSGYSHIARGTAKLLGIELMKNFEQPYLSRNITEFWRRWHISLSTWLKDYLYISLGGNRKGKIATYKNLMITMLLGGLWHGASWNFVIWGGLHGLYLAIHKLLLREKKVATHKIQKIDPSILVQIVGTYILVLFTWLFFRSTSWHSTKLFFSKVVNWEGSDHTFLFLSITSSYIIAVLVLDILEYVSNSHTYLLGIKYKGVRNGILCALLTVTFIYMFQAEPTPFIYFQF